MYKDKHLQREANKQASQRRRDKQKGMTQGMTNEGMTGSNSGTSVIPGHKAVIEIYRQAVQGTSKPERTAKPRPPGVSANQWAYIQMRAREAKALSTKGAGL